MALLSFNEFRGGSRQQSPTPSPMQPAPPDLGTQLEDILCAVWNAERQWRIEDRTDCAVRLTPPPWCGQR